MDKPAVDFVSLPDDFKLQILKKLDWWSLVQLKFSLKRPKIRSLKIFYDKYRPLRAVCTSKRNEGMLVRYVSKHIEFCDNSEYENFLKNIDFTEIKGLHLENLSNGGFITVDKGSDPYGRNSKCDVFARLPRGTSCFERLHTTISSPKELGIPYNGYLLRMQSLRRLGIFEGNKSSLVVKKIIMEILTGNPMLEYENTSAVTRKPLYVQITNHLFELGLLNPKNRCDRNKQFTLMFHRTFKFGVLRQIFYERIFDKIKFRNGGGAIGDNRVYITTNYMLCSKCHIEHKNFLFFHKPTNTLEIKFC